MGPNTKGNNSKGTIREKCFLNCSKSTMHKGRFRDSIFSLSLRPGGSSNEIILCVYRII